MNWIICNIENMTLITFYGNNKFNLMAGDSLIRTTYRKDIGKPDCETFYIKHKKVFAIGSVFIGLFGRKVKKFEEWVTSQEIVTIKEVIEKIKNNERRFERDWVGGNPTNLFICDKEEFIEYDGVKKTNVTKEIKNEEGCLIFSTQSYDKGLTETLSQLFSNLSRKYNLNNLDELVKLFDEFYHEIYKDFSLHGNFIGEDVNIYILDKSDDAIYYREIKSIIHNQKLTEELPEYWTRENEKAEKWFDDNFPWN